MPKVKVSIEIEIPAGATHYFHNIWDDPTFFKCKQIGVAGDHWFSCGHPDYNWKMVGHHKPHWIKDLSEIIIKS